MKIKKISSCIVLILLCTTLFYTNQISQAKSIQITNKESIKLNKTTKTLYVGESCKLSISGSNKKITWSTSKKSVATVSSKGIVTAKKLGKVIITAKLGKEKYNCIIAVKIKKVNNDGTLQLTGTIHEVKSFHTGNGEGMTSYVLDLKNEMPIILYSDSGQQYTAQIKSIQLVPRDEIQENEFKKYEGKKVTLKGYTIEGSNAWYIRDYGLTNVKIIK